MLPGLCSSTSAASYGGATKEGQEDQLGALGLVVNAIVLWNTRYMDAVLSKLQADGDAIADADARRLSPLVHKHLNFLFGRYHFSLPRSNPRDRLRYVRRNGPYVMSGRTLQATFRA